MSLALHVPVKCYITPTFFSAVILKKNPTNKQPQKESKLSSQLTIKLMCFLFLKAIFLAGLCQIDCTWRKKKSWHSCLAGLWDCFVLVMQWPKFSPLVLCYNQCEWGQVQVTVLVSCFVWFFPPTQKENVLRSVTAIFSCPHPPTSRLLSFLPELSCGIDSFLSSCFFVAVTYYSFHQVFEISLAHFHFLLGVASQILLIWFQKLELSVTIR